MRPLVEALCSEACAGRAPGTPGGIEGRRLVAQALTSAGLAVTEQPVPGCRGANLLATLPGRGKNADRWVLLAAHYDHLGRQGKQTYWGADDNAAAVAVMVEVAKAMVKRPPDGRGVVFAAFDGEEPPHFMNGTMGSQYFVQHATVPLDSIDAMLCMDLVGHAIGDARFPNEIRSTVFALGAERSEGTGAHVDSLQNVEPGLWVRRLDAEVIPPLSDYEPFWRRKVPFVFLTCGRWRHYHTPEDTPEKLDYVKMAALARWLERWTRETCARPETRFPFVDEANHASTLRSLVAITHALESLSPEAKMGRQIAEGLLAKCNAAGQLEDAEQIEQVQTLVALLESRFE
jgi:Zn-dependent M28 family amino/carboxypeptidase